MNTQINPFESIFSGISDIAAVMGQYDIRHGDTKADASADADQDTFRPNGRLSDFSGRLTATTFGGYGDEGAPGYDEADILQEAKIKGVDEYAERLSAEERIYDLHKLGRIDHTGLRYNEQTIEPDLIRGKLTVALMQKIMASSSPSKRMEYAKFLVAGGNFTEAAQILDLKEQQHLADEMARGSVPMDPQHGGHSQQLQKFESACQPDEGRISLMTLKPGMTPSVTLAHGQNHRHESGWALAA